MFYYIYCTAVHVFQIIAAVSDKASPNQSMMRFHPETGWAENPYAEKKRPLFFISDPPNLLKTLRNNLESSWNEGSSRHLWVSDLNMISIY